MTEKDFEKVLIGDHKWYEIRDIMIFALRNIDNEEKFNEFIFKIALSCGSLDHIKKIRKEIGLKPLSKSDEEKFKKDG